MCSSSDQTNEHEASGGDDEKPGGFACIGVKIGEAVRIGENIDVSVSKIYSGGTRATIAIRAPLSLKIRRPEKK